LVEQLVGEMDEMIAALSASEMVVMLGSRLVGSMVEMMAAMSAGEMDEMLVA